MYGQVQRWKYWSSRAVSQSLGWCAGSANESGLEQALVFVGAIYRYDHVKEGGRRAIQ
jgi:hypothetical protein